MGSILGVAMFFIGKILIVNAAWLQGKVDTKDAGVFNIIVAAIGTACALHIGLVQGNYPLFGALMLFNTTYWYVGVNAIRGATDQRGLGLYCLTVAIVTIPFAVHAYLGHDIGFTVEWITYGILWFLFFMVLTLGNQAVMPLTIFMTYLVGIEVWVTGWAFMYGYWPFGK